MLKKRIHKAKLLIKKILRLEVNHKVDILVPTEMFGSQYGGWTLLKDSVKRDSVIYSFGIGEDTSFDIALIARFKAIIHAFDPTPKSIRWVNQNMSSPEFILHEYGVAGFDGSVKFNPPSNPEHVSFTMLDRKSRNGEAITVPVKRVATIMEELGHENIDILKMDIEGAEYDVIDDFLNEGIYPMQLLVEYHHRFSNVGIAKTNESIRKLRNAGYRLFFISATNQEFSFERSRKI